MSYGYDADATAANDGRTHGADGICFFGYAGNDCGTSEGRDGVRIGG